MFTTYQFSEPYPTDYALDPFQSSYSYYAMQQELKKLYRQQLIEQERRRQAAAMEQAIIAAYERERIVRAAKQLAYQREVADRRRRQYEEFYQKQLLNNFLGNLLSEDNEDEEMNDDCCAYDYEAMQCNKRARLYHKEPKPLYKRQDTSPRKLHHRRKYQQQQEDNEVWLLVQHLKSVDENEAAEASQSTAAVADKGKGKAVERDANVTKETFTQAPKSNDDHPSEENTPVNVETVLRKLKTIGEKLDVIQEKHESVVLATPLTFDTESEDLSRSAPNKEFFSYEDDIMKVLLELDAVESYGLEDIRNQRKALVAKSENLLKIIDEYKQKEWERASASSGAESDTETDKDVTEDSQVEAPVGTQVEVTEDAPVEVIEDQTEPMETEEQETTNLTGLVIDAPKESNVQESTPELAETLETQLPGTNVDATDDDMQVDTTSGVIAEEATSSSVKEVTDHDQEVSEPIEDEKQLPEVPSEEDLDFEKIDSVTAASNEPSSSITNPTEATVTEDEFDMVDDHDVHSQNSAQSEQRPSNQEQTSSKPIQIPIHWSDN
ncbi:hypothetical protein K450DRAFT_202945 [Umbelopsis ramanniana AG]|uniref:BAG domain-containing protein n=1 Tax=Umbelopsis ramanniana AG TaxID=1314678 RepID=A0AAD5HA06_UMBRA|nr:uncharacterized protein K450DRAFT_202945 [Umbelopsis ramanniana AG]KAI8575324.1 hypothetical protein K450DRAFT_202945 [Umbelopsis ramanniana AG]